MSLFQSSYSQFCEQAVIVTPLVEDPKVEAALEKLKSGLYFSGRMSGEENLDTILEQRQQETEELHGVLEPHLASNKIAVAGPLGILLIEAMMDGVDADDVLFNPFWKNAFREMFEKETGTQYVVVHPTVRCLSTEGMEL